MPELAAVVLLLIGLVLLAYALPEGAAQDSLAARSISAATGGVCLLLAITLFTGLTID